MRRLVLLAPLGALVFTVLLKVAIPIEAGKVGKPRANDASHDHDEHEHATA